MASNVELTEAQADALSELKRHESRSAAPFWWRRASMKKLEAIGLVEGWLPSGFYDATKAYRITPAGLEALREVEGR